jgi:hypothetical protein
MIDLEDDDILYSGRGNEKDTRLSDDHHNIIIYNWCSIFFLIDVVYKSYRVQKWKRDEVDPYDIVYNNLPKKHFVLHKVKPCGYCNVKQFPLEGPSFYYRQGKVKLHTSYVPDELR